MFPPSAASHVTAAADAVGKGPFCLFPEPVAILVYLLAWVAVCTALLVFSLRRWGLRAVMDGLEKALAATNHTAEQLFAGTVAVGPLTLIVLLLVSLAPLLLYAAIPAGGFVVGRVAPQWPLLVIDRKQDVDSPAGLIDQIRGTRPPIQHWYATPVSWGERVTVTGLCRLGMLRKSCRRWLDRTERSRMTERLMGNLALHMAARELDFCVNTPLKENLGCIADSWDTRHRLRRGNFGANALLTVELQAAAVRKREAFDPDRLFLQEYWRLSVADDLTHLADYYRWVGGRHPEYTIDALLEIIPYLSAVTIWCLVAGMCFGRPRMRYLD